MTEYLRHRAGTWAERVYRALLSVYPADFREEFGDAMAEFFHDRLACARASRASGAVPRLWWSVLRDVMRNAIPVRLDSLRRTFRRWQYRSDAIQNSPTLHASRRSDWMLTSILQDVRYAMRNMMRQPVFTLVILATLALGIGANAAIFSVVNGIMLRPLPYQDADRIVQVDHTAPSMTVSEPEFYDYKRDLHSIQSLSAMAGASATISGGTQDPGQLQLMRVTDDFFGTLGMAPQKGRAFQPDEMVRGAPRVIVLSHGMWQARFGGDSLLVGKDILVNERPYTVVGIMPPSFAYPSREVDAWVPLRLNPDSLWTRNNHYLTLVGRLAPRASPASAAVEMNTVTKRLARDFPEYYKQPLVANIEPVNDALIGRTRPYLYTLLGTVGFVLLIACVNVANLLLARGESRKRELALRSALGASRLRIVRQVLTESALLALAGGIAGLLLAWGLIRVLLALAPASIPRLDEIRVDPTVLAFTMVITLVTGVLFGMVPALRGARDDAGETLKSTGRTGGQARGLRRARATLVVCEVALAVMTLTGAGLMIRSLRNLQSIELGIRPEHVLSFHVSLSAQKYTDTSATQFYQTLSENLRAQAGVVSVGAVGDLPVADGNSIWSILLNGSPMMSVSDAPSAMPEPITPGYFHAMGVRMLRGREFLDSDRASAPMVAIVNQAMEKKYWPGRSAIGGTIKMLNEKAPWATVVGVVSDVRHNGYLVEPPPTMYFPHAQAGRSAYYVPFDMNLVVRTSGDPLSIVAAVRNVTRALDAQVPISRMQTMERIVAESIAGRRYATQALTAFAVVALLLAAIGIYGVISYGVSQRTLEIGLRVALGAQRGQVARLVIGEGATLAAIGLVAGIAGSLAAARYMQSMFVEVKSGDPVTLGMVVLLLALVALLASWLPARRAIGVDPLEALRSD